MESPFNVFLCKGCPLIVFSFLWVQLHCQWHVLFVLFIVNVHIHCPAQEHVNH